MKAGEFLIRASEWYPKKVGVIFEGKRLTFGQLNQRVNCISQALIDLGVQMQERVAILCHNCHQYVEVLYAAAKTGVALVPLNTRLSGKELCFQIQESGAKLLFVSTRLKAIWNEVSQFIPCDIRCISIDGKINGMLDYDEFIIEDCLPEPSRMQDIQDEDVLIQMYTSGTTGRPKGVLLTNKNAYASVLNNVIQYPYSKDSHLLQPFPLFHIAIWSSLLLCYAGITHSYIGGFDPGKFMEHIEQERGTDISLAGTMLHMMIEHQEFEKRDLSSLRGILNGGAPIAVAHMKKMREKVPSAKFYNVYGMTETFGAITMLAEWELGKISQDQFWKKMSSVGRSFFNSKVMIMDNEDRECPTGSVGEICVTGEQVMKGYHNMPQLTAEVKRNGMYHTGDIGYVDDDGYYFLVDRKNDMIITGGENVYPNEVEQVIRGMEGVGDVVVIGVPHEKWDEAVKAVLIPRRGALLNEGSVIEHCVKNGLAGYKRPKSVEFVERLPVNLSGKVLRREVREKFWKANRR